MGIPIIYMGCPIKTSIKKGMFYDLSILLKIDVVSPRINHLQNHDPWMVTIMKAMVG